MLMKKPLLADQLAVNVHLHDKRSPGPCQVAIYRRQEHKSIANMDNHDGIR